MHKISYAYGYIPSPLVRWWLAHIYIDAYIIYFYYYYNL